MNTSTFRKVLATTVVSSALALTSLAGGAASADGGQHEVGHWMGMMPPAPTAPIHKAINVTMKRGVVGASQPITVGSNQTEWYWPGVTKYTDVNLGRAAPDQPEPPAEVVSFVFHEIKNHAGTDSSFTNVLPKAYP